MSRIDLARKLFRFLQVNRIPPNKRTKPQKELHAALDTELGDDLDRVFKSVNLKPEPLFTKDDDQADTDE